MKKLYVLSIGLLCSLTSWGQSNPIPFNLSGGATYSFTSWPSTSGAGTYPANMVFQQSIDPTNAGFNPLAPGTTDWACSYNLTARSRFLGKEASGISYLATADPQFNDCAGLPASNTRFVGSVLLAITTTNRDGILVSWTAGTVSAGARTFSIQLQYRLGTSGDFTNVASTYTSGATGSSQAFSLILPSAVENKPVVQLRWVYYQTAAGSGGTRPELRLDDITVGSTALPVTYLSFQARYTAEKMVAVSWATVAETDNAHFEVERSVDAVSYISLGRVAGKGTTTARQTYTFTDEAPAPGWNYYRLRQVDRDGAASLSRPVAVLNENALDNALMIMPNPASSLIRLALAGGQVPQQVSVVGLSGQRTVLPVSDGDKLNVTELPAALYLIEVQTATGRVLRQRLLKQ